MDKHKAEVQAVYETHRMARNAQQRDKLLDPAFPGVTIDPVLHKIVNPAQYPGYTDPRNCLVFWARPSTVVKKLIEELQKQLCELAPSLNSLNLKLLPC